MIGQQRLVSFIGLCPLSLSLPFVAFRLHFESTVAIPVAKITADAEEDQLVSLFSTMFTANEVRPCVPALSLHRLCQIECLSMCGEFSDNIVRQDQKKKLKEMNKVVILLARLSEVFIHCVATIAAMRICTFTVFPCQVVKYPRKKLTSWKLPYQKVDCLLQCHLSKDTPEVESMPMALKMDSGSVAHQAARLCSALVKYCRHAKMCEWATCTHLCPLLRAKFHAVVV